MKQRFRPYAAVLQTYLRRRLFWVAALVLLYHPLSQIARPVVDLTASTYLTGATYQTTLLSILCLGFPVFWTAHLREQFRLSRGLILPHRVLPHMRVGAAVLIFYIGAALVLLIGTDVFLFFFKNFDWHWNSRFFVSLDDVRTLFWPEFDWLFLYAVAAIICTIVAALCATFGSPWLTLILVPLSFAASTGSHFDVFAWISNLPWIEQSQPWHRAFLISVVLPVSAAVVPLVALQVRLRQLARPSAKSQSRGTMSSAAPAVATVRRASLMGASLRDRVRYRRSAALSTKAVGIVALFLGALLVVLAPLVTIIVPRGYSLSEPALQVQNYLILTSILPATVAALLWRERLPRLNAESLQAVTRQRFITEITLAVLLDVLQYWLAVAVAVLAPLALFPDAPVNWSAMLVRLGASGLVQVPVFAAILIGLQSRSWPVLIGLAAVAMGVGAAAFVVTPFHVTLQPLERLLPAAGVIAASGAVLGLAGYLRWLVAKEL